MSEDVERLFRNINQANIPYQVFEPPKVPSPAIGYAEFEPVAPEQAAWKDEPPTTAARSPVFRNYGTSPNAQPVAQTVAGTALGPIFASLREKCNAAEA